MRLEATYDTSIKWLNERRHVQCEKLQLDIAGLVGDIMARKVVDEQTNTSILAAHLDV